MDGNPIWLLTENQAHPPLRGKMKADAVVVGGGLCGVTTAYLLARGGLHVTLLEAGRLGHGASGHTMAKVSVQHGLIYSRLLSTWGREVAQAYAITQQNALHAMASLVAEMNIPCYWAEQDASLIALNRQEERLLEKEASAAQASGLASSIQPGGACPVPVRCLLTLPAQAAFDPIAYLQALAQSFSALGGHIFEESRVQAVTTQGVATETGSVQAPFVIIATHFPIVNFPGWYFLRARQERGHMAALEEAPVFQGMYTYVGRDYFSLRRRDGLALFEGLPYLCGTQTDMDHDGLIRLKSSSLFPGSRPAFTWHGQDVISADGLPFIGPYSQRTPNHFVGAGFSKWGMTGTMAAAQAISARILGGPMLEAEIYDPARTWKHGLAPVIRTACATTSDYIKGLFHKNAPRCPHMGCRLKYVPATASWACPCHGSRFDSIGRIKNTPAVHAAKIKNTKRFR